MTADAVPRWRAALLAGEPHELTTDELLAEFNRDFATPTLTARQLRQWTEFGLVPKPRRRVPPQASDGVVRALYPWWTVHVVAELLGERSRGTKLAALRATAAERLARWQHDPLVDPAVALAMAHAIPPAVPLALQRAVDAYLEQYGRSYRGGLPPGVKTTLVLYNNDGFQETIAIPRPQPPRPHKDRKPD